MKLSKKILAALSTAALLATAGSFMSCSDDDDDDFNIISGSNNKYFITGGSYTNDTTETQRGFDVSTFEHIGAIVQIKMNKENKGQGAMGFLWDFDKAKDDGTYSRASKGARRFCLAGFNYKSDGKVHYYVSSYKDVDDIQLKNFGAEVKSSNDFETGLKDVEGTKTAEEVEIIQLNSNNAFTPKIDEETGDFVVTIVVRPDMYNLKDGSTTEYEQVSWKKGSGKYYTNIETVYILNGAYTAADLENVDDPVTGAFATIKAEDLGYTLPTGDNVIDAGNSLTLYKKCPFAQKKFGPYANVYGKSTLKGSWVFFETYKEDEVVEE